MTATPKEIWERLEPEEADYLLAVPDRYPGPASEDEVLVSERLRAMGLVYIDQHLGHDRLSQTGRAVADFGRKVGG